MSRSDAEVLELLRSAQPDDARLDARAAELARERPASSLSAPPASRRPRVAMATAAAVTLVALGVAAAVLVLGTSPIDPTLVPASQPSQPSVAGAPVDTEPEPRDSGAVGPPEDVSGPAPAEGTGSPLGQPEGPPAHVPGTGLQVPGQAPLDPPVPIPGGPSIPAESAPAAGVPPIDVNVLNRKPLPFCGTIVADDSSGVDAAEWAMADCYWALVEANVPAEVIWAGHDRSGSSFTLIIRHTGDRRGETAKQYRDATGAYAWFAQRCTGVARGPDLLAVDRSRTVCGPDEPM